MTMMSAPAQEWVRDAICPQTDPEAFYPERGNSTLDAKRVCAGCPVRAQCLDYAMTVERDAAYRFGVWGGLSPDERARLAAGAVVVPWVGKPKPEKPAEVGADGRRLKPIRHGTAGGAQAHYRRGESPCESCAAAKAAAQQRYYLRSKAKAHVVGAA